MSPSTHRRSKPTIGQRLTGLAALITLLALVTLPPLVLARIVGWPLPHNPNVADMQRSFNGSWSLVPWDTVAVKAFAVGFWLCWARFVFNVAAATVNLARQGVASVGRPGGRDTSRDRAETKTRRPRREVRQKVAFNRALATRLVATAALLLTGTGVMANSSTQTADAYPLTHARPAAVSSAAARPTAEARPVTTSPTASAAANHYDRSQVRSTPAHLSAVGQPEKRFKLYTVAPPTGRHHDTLWGIAERHLGDGERWKEIFDLNEGVEQSDGHALHKASLIQPGWVLKLPADAVGLPEQAAPTAPATGPTAPAHPSKAHEATAHRPSAAHHAPAPAAAPVSPPATARHTAPVTPPASAEVGQQGGEGTEHVPQTGAATGAWNEAPNGATSVRLPVTSPAAPSGAQHGEKLRDEDDLLHDASTLVAFAGGGVLLAGAMYAAVGRGRRAQMRHRRPGRAAGAAPPPPGLSHVQRAVAAAGSAGVADVNWLNHALRSLCRDVARGDGPLPDVLAAKITENRLELLLTRPATHATAPWLVEDGGERWVLPREADVGFTADDVPYYFAPYPTLVTVGHTAEGEHWLIDLERLAALSLSGDPDRCLSLARFLAAELAHNTWSEALQVTLVGFGAEMAAMNPARLAHTEDLTSAVRMLQTELDSERNLIAAAGTGVLEGRLRMSAGDGFAPHVLLIAPELAGDHAGLAGLMEAMRATPEGVSLPEGHSNRTAIAVVLAGDADVEIATRWKLHVGTDGVLRIPALGLELIASQLPLEEAADLAAMLAMVGVTEDRPMPASRSSAPWARFADEAGGVLPEFTLPRAEPVRDLRLVPDVQVVGLENEPPWMASVLPLPTASYLKAAATTGADLQRLAPQLSADVRREINRTVSALDEQLAAFLDPSSTVPRLHDLGELKVQAHGTHPGTRLKVATEVILLLACHEKGLTPRQVAAALFGEENADRQLNTAKVYVSFARKWLGVNPATGLEDYLTDASLPASRGLYRLQGVLIASDLCRKLRLRGTASSDGIGDFEAAFALVEGEPFSGRLGQRGGAYGWLFDGQLDHVYYYLIADLAHVLAVHYLAAGRPQDAHDVALKAYECSPAARQGDVTLLDLAVASADLGNRAEAGDWVGRLLDTTLLPGQDDVDLQKRTFELLHQRGLIPHRQLAHG